MDPKDKLTMKLLKSHWQCKLKFLHGQEIHALKGSCYGLLYETPKDGWINARIILERSIKNARYAIVWDNRPQHTNNGYVGWIDKNGPSVESEDWALPLTEYQQKKVLKWGRESGYSIGLVSPDDFHSRATLDKIRVSYL